MLPAEEGIPSALTMKLIIFTLFLAFSGQAECLDCYTCTYGMESLTNTASCADPFKIDGRHVVKTSCNDIKDALCATMRDYKNGQVATVARACFPTSVCPNPNGCDTTDGVNICCCNTDYCNGSAAIFAVNVLTIAGSLIMVLVI